MLEEMLGKIEIFNAGGVISDTLGYRIERYPVNVHKNLSAMGNYYGAHSCGCEIRFVKENADSMVNVTLRCENLPGNVVVMQGDRWVELINFNPGDIKTICINKSNFCPEENEGFFEGDSYDRKVVRIVLSSAIFVLCDINTFGKDIRPPKAEELPRYTALAYGSSITHGAGSPAGPLCYISHAAALLDTQIMNKGLGGSCFMEKCVADWFCGIPFDYMIFEPGTNMYDDYENKVIEERGKYMLLKMLDSHPDSFVFMVEPPMIFRQKKNSDKYKSFIESIYNIYNCAKSDKCVIFPNNKIQLKGSYVSCDLIHPTPFGHVMMGTNLAGLIRPYLENMN